MPNLGLFAAWTSFWTLWTKPKLQRQEVIISQLSWWLDKRMSILFCQHINLLSGERATGSFICKHCHCDDIQTPLFYFGRWDVWASRLSSEVPEDGSMLDYPNSFLLIMLMPIVGRTTGIEVPQYSSNRWWVVGFLSIFVPLYSPFPVPSCSAALLRLAPTGLHLQVTLTFIFIDVWYFVFSMTIGVPLFFSQVYVSVTSFICIRFKRFRV